MTDDNQAPLDAYQEFPEVGSGVDDNQNQTIKGDRSKGFQNVLFPNDSITQCSGFINEVRPYTKDGDTMYFIRAGLIQGSKKNGDGDWVGDITNCDLIAGATLKKWAESMQKHKEAFEGIRLTFTIRNLKFIPDMYEEKPVLRSRGILEMITMGHIDK